MFEKHLSRNSQPLTKGLAKFGGVGLMIERWGKRDITYHVRIRLDGKSWAVSVFKTVMLILGLNV